MQPLLCLVQLSYADLALWAILNMTFLRVEGAKALEDNFPAIKSFLAGVASRERIKAYLARDVYSVK